MNNQVVPSVGEDHVVPDPEPPLPMRSVEMDHERAYRLSRMRDRARIARAQQDQKVPTGEYERPPQRVDQTVPEAREEEDPVLAIERRWLSEHVRK